jgi:hypothetical protein
MTLSYVDLLLSLRFYRHVETVEKNHNGFNYYYDFKNGIGTLVNTEGATFLLLAARTILLDKKAEKGMRAVLQYNETTLILECKPEENNQMAAYLTIEKNDESISFKFKTTPVQVQENGQTITEIIESSLEAFAKALEEYLARIEAELSPSKVPDNLKIHKMKIQEVSNTTVENGSYQ